MTVTLTPIPDIPLINAGDDLGALLASALRRLQITPENRDILVVAQKVVSKAEGRTVDLLGVVPSARATALAEEVRKDPRLVEVILSESSEVVRHRPDVLIVRHRLGFVMANAGVDQSNVGPSWSDTVLLLPRAPDESAAALKAELDREFGVEFGRRHQRQFRPPVASGCRRSGARRRGVPALWNLVGAPDLFGRPMRMTEVALADEIAAAASLLMGESNEGIPAVHVRGTVWKAEAVPAAALLRPMELDSVPMTPPVLALCGGIGGAKLALGLYHALGRGELIVAVNTGDDFEHLGLAHLARHRHACSTRSAASPTRSADGAGREETLEFHDGRSASSAEKTWFQLGDRDLASSRRAHPVPAWQAHRLSASSPRRRRLGIERRIAADDGRSVRTIVETDEGELAFPATTSLSAAAEPVVRAIRFAARERAQPAPRFAQAIARSVASCHRHLPVQSLPQHRSDSGRARRARRAVTRGAPVIAVSPIIGGQAVKGPTAKIMAELGVPATPHRSRPTTAA